MKILVGRKALDWAKKNQRRLTPNETVILKYFLQVKDIEVNDATEAQIQNAQVETNSAINRLSLTTRSHHYQAATKFIDTCGPDVFTVTIESSDPHTDERRVMRALLEILLDNDKEQYVGGTADQIAEIINRTLPKLDPNTVYNACLRLAKKGLLRKLPLPKNKTYHEVNAGLY